MKHFRILVEYEGTEYVGWQVQRHGASVQGLIQEAMSKVTGESTPVVAAGRTDAGVHAMGQVASFRSGTRLEAAVLLRALNASLPGNIRIVDIEEAAEDFHPRYDAIAKQYVYLIQNRRKPSVFFGRWVWTVPQPLNIADMEAALGSLVGTHDFSAFRASGCGARSAVKNLGSLRVETLESCEIFGMNLPDTVIRITAEGDAFLRHMVRNLVGLGVEVGKGRIAPEDVPGILHTRDRRLSGPTAPARGLFLHRVIYRNRVFHQNP